MQFFHFYFFGNPEGLAFNGTRQDMGTSLVQPLALAIERQGGKIITGVNVSEIRTQDGQIDCLFHGQGEGQNDVPFWIERNPNVGCKGGFNQSDLLTDMSVQPASIEYYGAGDNVFAATPEAKEAISLTCTHQGCTVQLADDDMFHCPCHGAMFDREGRVVKGPAIRNLPRFQVLQRQPDRLQLVARSCLLYTSPSPRD